MASPMVTRSSNTRFARNRVHHQWADALWLSKTAYDAILNGKPARDTLTWVIECVSETLAAGYAPN